MEKDHAFFEVRGLWRDYSAAERHSTFARLPLHVRWEAVPKPRVTIENSRVVWGDMILPQTGRGRRGDGGSCSGH